MSKISLKKHWVSTDGWRGYEQPIYAVCGANDTGMWSDSPCKSDVAYKELELAKKALKQAGINHKKTTCRSSNVFCVHHYLVVPEEDVQKGKEIIRELLQTVDTQLLYDC